MRKTQITLEAAAIFSMVMAGLLAVTLGYYRGALQGNWRTNIDGFSQEQSCDVESFVGGGGCPQDKVRVDIYGPSVADGSGNGYKGGGGIIEVSGWGTYK